MGTKKRYSSVMEKIIKNAVSETSKVLETVIAELKAEVLRVTDENENLKIRCSQFEEVVKKRSVYRETGTSPEPWIIEKCDKAVQCEFFFRQSDDENPNLSDNETQSERSFGPLYEKESSNDSFSFLKTKDIEGNSCSPLDLSNETTPEKSVDILIDKSCLEPQFDHMDNSNTYEMPSQSSEQQNVLFESLHNERHKDSGTCYETFEMESQDDVCIEYAKTDPSLLECQEAGQKEVNEDICLSTETEDVGFEKSKANNKECESRPLHALPAESASSSNVPQLALEEETSDMDVEIDQQSTLSSQLKPGDSSTADAADTPFALNFEQVDACPAASRCLDQPVPLSEDIKRTDGPTEPEQVCTEMDDTAVQSVSSEDIHAKKAQNTSQPTSPPKSQYFLRRQRCTSVTLEDAMLLLDAVSQQKYKLSPPKKSQTKNVATPKLDNIPEATVCLAHDACNSELIACATESLQPHVTHSSVTTETAKAMELEECLINEDIQHQHTIWPVEAVIDRGVSTSTPIKNTKPLQVTEADSAALNIEDQHDHHNILSSFTASSSSHVTEGTAHNLSSAKLDETVQAVDTNTTIEYDKIVTSPSLVEPPNDASVPQEALAKQNIKASKQDQLLEMRGIVSSDECALDSQQHDTFLSAAPSTISSSVQPGKSDDAEYLSTPTEEGEMTPVTPDHRTQKEVVLIDLTLPIDSTPSKALAQTLSEPILQTPSETTEMLDQISGHSDHDGGEFQDDRIDTASSTLMTSPILNPPTQHTVLLQMPGDTGDQSSSLVKTITSSSTLSPAQLSAVVSAVRSTQSRTSPPDLSAGTPSGKKAFVAVPFSLQSVMRPHHKIIVIPRQCKVPPSQAIAKEKAIVLKQKAFATEATTTVISTTDVNPETTSDEGNSVNSVDQQQTTSVTTTTQSLPDTDPLIIESSSSDPAKSPCKNTVQIKLNRISFPVSSTQSVSVTDMPITLPPKKRRGRPPLKKKIAIDSNQSKAQPKEDHVFSPVIEPSPRLSSKEASPIRSSPGQNDISVEENQSPTPEQLSPHIVAADHSYPQHRMTKSQFLAKLEVSPVTQISKKADSFEKDAQKASLVDRLRSHLKPHIKTIKKIQKTEERQDGSNVSIETTSPVFTTPQDTSRPNQDQLCENLPSLDENKNATPKTSPAPKNVSNKAQVKRKRSPKRNLTPTKTVKKRKMKKAAASNENVPSGPKLSPMRSKIINSNALLSCVRKGIKKKSFLCKFCRKEFGKKKEIELHIQIHVGKKPFQCNICHRRFSRTMELSRHLKRHNADKKFQCTSCGKSFIEYNNLKRHSYIHTGEKPFSCPHCPRAFTQSGHMRTHIRTKHQDMED